MSESPYTPPSAELDSSSVKAGERCPTCGEIKGGQNISRNKLVLIMLALGWTLAFWLGFIFLGGIVVGIMNSGAGDAAAEAASGEFGEAAAIPALLISFVASILLTISGILPGTRKDK